MRRVHLAWDVVEIAPERQQEKLAPQPSRPPPFCRARLACPHLRVRGQTRATSDRDRVTAKRTRGGLTRRNGLEFFRGGKDA
jgi:hypothetical protein